MRAQQKKNSLIRTIIYNGNVAPRQTETFEWNSWMIRDFNSSIHIDNARNKHDLTNRKFEVECSANTLLGSRRRIRYRLLTNENSYCKIKLLFDFVAQKVFSSIEKKKEVLKNNCCAKSFQRYRKG